MFVKRLSFILLLVFGLNTQSQVVIQNGSLANAKLCQVAPAPSGWTLIGTGVATGSSDGVNVTSSSYNTVGASAIFVIVTGVGGQPTPTSSPANTFTKVVEQLVSFGGESCAEWVCLSPSTSSTMTVSIASGNQPSIAVMAFSGGTGTTDKTSGGFSGASPVQPGSITPASNSELIISGAASKFGTVSSVDSGFSTPLTTVGSGGAAVGLGMAYLIQSTAAPVNPSWGASSSTMVSTIASHVQ